MNSISPKYREMLNAMARGIDEIINGKKRPKKVGFALLLFEFDKIKAGRMNWISSAERQDMITALKEMVAQLEGRVAEVTSEKQ